MGIVDFVNSCWGKEFSKDREQFIRINKRESRSGEAFIMACRDYDENRKKQFLKCINDLNHLPALIVHYGYSNKIDRDKRVWYPSYEQERKSKIPMIRLGDKLSVC